MQGFEGDPQRLAVGVERENSENVLEASVNAIAQEPVDEGRGLVVFVLELRRALALPDLFVHLDLALDDGDDSIELDHDFWVRASYSEEGASALVTDLEARVLRAAEQPICRILRRARGQDARNPSMNVEGHVPVAECIHELPRARQRHFAKRANRVEIKLLVGEEQDRERHRCRVERRLCPEHAARAGSVLRAELAHHVEGRVEPGLHGVVNARFALRRHGTLARRNRREARGVRQIVELGDDLVAELDLLLRGEGIGLGSLGGNCHFFRLLMQTLFKHSHVSVVQRA